MRFLDNVDSHSGFNFAPFGERDYSLGEAEPRCQRCSSGRRRRSITQQRVSRGVPTLGSETSLCGSLCDLCGSVVNVFRSNLTTETQSITEFAQRDFFALYSKGDET